MTFCAFKYQTSAASPASAKLMKTHIGNPNPMNNSIGSDIIRAMDRKLPNNAQTSEASFAAQRLAVLAIFFVFAHRTQSFWRCFSIKYALEYGAWARVCQKSSRT